MKKGTENSQKEEAPPCLGKKQIDRKDSVSRVDLFGTFFLSAHCVRRYRAGIFFPC